MRVSSVIAQTFVHTSSGFIIDLLRATQERCVSRPCDNNALVVVHLLAASCGETTLFTQGETIQLPSYLQYEYVACSVSSLQQG